ncbi:uncharacterized protein LOC105688618 [Athalia rosae]|uniref:uncharacterized protein LOC105688618 n=1 Tax=Athalia rosae TaxID=37344 RepID=UPI002034A517|nr:uncharacterized protein LOC105688618 [Athalia rosae]XP_048512586.1 uncharacterized protein LOC105688618 [Athalia rosae]
MKMREQREVISYRGASAITAVTRSLMFMLVFCYAGCAAGSCLSYGHSCWGAHGKRSGHNYAGAGNPTANNERSSMSGAGAVQGPLNDGESLRDQWILSRLVTRQLSAPGAEKFRGNWYDSNRGRGHGRNWDSNDVGVVSDTAKTIRRDQVDIEDEDEDDEIRDEAVVLPRLLSRETRGQVLEPRDIPDDDELLLVPPSDHDHLKPIGQSHKLRLFKILNSAAGKIK